MKSPGKVGRRAPPARPRPPRRRGVASAITGSPAEGLAADAAFEPRALAGVDGAVNESIEALSEAEGPRESEQAVGAAGRLDADAGAPSEGPSPPLLEEQ